MSGSTSRRCVAALAALSCHSVYETGMSVDPGATITATLVPTGDVVEGDVVEHALNDTGGAPTTVFQQQLPAGDWRVTSVASAYAKNPNNSIGGAQGFVRCAVFAGTTRIDGGATVLIDTENYEQQILDTAAHSASAAWTVKLKCSHDTSISTGSHWTIRLLSPVIAVRKGPIRSHVT